MKDNQATRRTSVSIAWSLALIAAGCGGGAGSPLAAAPAPAPWASSPGPAPAPAPATTPAPAPAPQISLSAPEGPQLAVYKSFGSRQCEGGGLTLEALAAQLTNGGVPVTAASCGNTGLLYLTVCGAPTGGIGIMEVPQSQAANAAALGFAPLASLPQATKFPCLPS